MFRAFLPIEYLLDDPLGYLAMSGELTSYILSAAVVVCVTTSVVGVLAFACAKRRAIGAYISCLVLLWIAVAWMLGHSLIVTSPLPHRIPDWRHFLDAFVSISPLIIVPSSLVFACVLGKIPIRRIPLLALFGLLVALPLTAFSALLSSCYVALDCL
jgi:hypothetical protein